MIISHKHRFIFLRTEKTAGTSLEFALAPFCGPEDILTGTNPRVALRLGLKPRKSLRYLPIRGALRRSLPQYFGLHTHAPAAQVKAFVSDRIFNSYYKFAVERNPWDRQVSLYYQRAQRYLTPPRDFNRDMNSALYRSFHYTRLRNWEVYTIGDQIVVDEVIRYETLAQGLATVLGKLGLPGDIEIDSRRSGYRPSCHYRDFYIPRTQQLIADWYSKEIAAFDYHF
jgi:Sulfotransferase family